jgi:Ca2+-binding EF-hand superfamily protein
MSVNITGASTVTTNLFNAIDKDGNGFLSYDEIRATNDAYLIGQFGPLDTNGDGKISTTEFTATDQRNQRINELINYIDEQTTTLRNRLTGRTSRDFAWRFSNAFSFGACSSHLRRHIQDAARELNGLLGTNVDVGKRIIWLGFLGTTGNLNEAGVNQLLQMGRGALQGNINSTVQSRLDSSQLRGTSFANLASGLTIDLDKFRRAVRNVLRAGQTISDAELQRLFDAYKGSDDQINETEWNRFVNDMTGQNAGVSN